MEITEVQKDHPIQTMRYILQDYQIKDESDNAIATVCLSKLNPGESTRGHVDNHNEVYLFLDGRGVMLIDKDMSFIEPRPGEIEQVFVNKGQFHRVLNCSSVSPLDFISIVPGKVNRMPYQSGPDSDPPDSQQG